MHNMGIAYYTIQPSDLARAAEACKNAAELFNNHGMIQQGGAALSDFGFALLLAGHYPAATNALKDALTVYNRSDSPGPWLVTHLRYGAALESSDNLIEALAAYQEVLPDVTKRNPNSGTELFNHINELKLVIAERYFRTSLSRHEDNATGPNHLATDTSSLSKPSAHSTTGKLHFLSPPKKGPRKEPRT